MTRKPPVPYPEVVTHLVWDDVLPFPSGKSENFLVPILCQKTPQNKRIIEDGYCISFPIIAGKQIGPAPIGTYSRVLAPEEKKDHYQMDLSCLFRVRLVGKADATYKGGSYPIWHWDEISDHKIPKEVWNDPQFIIDRSCFAGTYTRAFNELQKYLFFRLEQVSDPIQKDALRHTFKMIITFGLSCAKALLKPQRESFGLLLDQICLFFVSAALRVAAYDDVALKISNVFFPAFQERVVAKRFFDVRDSFERLLPHLDPMLGVFADMSDDETDDMKNGTAVTKVPINGTGDKLPSYPERYQQIKERLSPEARKAAEEKLGFQNERGALPNWVRSYLDVLLGLPWQVFTKDTKDLGKVKDVLDKHHWGLGEVKERILEYLAIRQVNPSAESPILCLVGPPGTGKTSLGKSIAAAMGRKFVRLSLGSVRDETEIKGHRSTYIGALPGKIISLIKEGGSSNPVFLIDEVDKINRDFRGDPSAALLEIFDPNLNTAYRDTYLDVPYDLSQVLFIVTANTQETILEPLQNRLEFIELSSYTPTEKLHIAKDFLIPKRKANAKFPIVTENKTTDIQFTDETISEVIHAYTYEAGVRDLEKVLDRPYRKVRRYADKYEGMITIDKTNLEEFCGKPKIRRHSFPKVFAPGVMIVLAATDLGGHVFDVEINYNFTQGPRKLKMQGIRASGMDKDSANKIEESERIAFNALTMKGGILEGKLQNIEVNHSIFMEGHMTNGAVPKDGPSAGLSLCIAVYSILAGRSVKPSSTTPLIGATGEITQNLMTVNAIGGLREKLIAAQRAGIKTVIIPKENERDLENVPTEIISQLDIVCVQYLWEALEFVFSDDDRVKKYAAQKRFELEG